MSTSRFIIFVDYSNLDRAYHLVFGERLTIAVLKSLLESVKEHCKLRGLYPPENHKPYTYLYVADQPRAQLDQYTRQVVVGIERHPIEGVVLRKGYLSLNEEDCDRKQRGKDGAWRSCTSYVQHIEEKEVEVSLTTDLVRFACKNWFQTAVLISGDRDFIPAVRVVQKSERKHIINIFWKLSEAQNLADHCSDFVDIRALHASVSREPSPKISQAQLQRILHYEGDNGRRLTASDVEAWIKQFGNERNQQFAATLLEKIDFFNRNRIKKIVELFLSQLLKEKLQSEIGISPLGNMGDSTSIVNYVSQPIFAKHGLRCEDLYSLSRNPEIKTIIFLDDNVGSGMQACDIFLEWFGKSKEKSTDEEHVTELTDDLKTWLKGRAIAIFTCMAYTDGIARLKSKLPELGLSLYRVEPFEIHNKEIGCFNATRGLFAEEDREAARSMVEEIGYQLLSHKDWPDERKKQNALGYGGNEGLTVFFYNTPTSTLPIFWARGEVNGMPWCPLFPRREKN